MKTTICALMVLAVILTAGFWFQSTLTKTCAGFETDLNVCFSQATTNHWNEAAQTLTKLKKRIDAHKTLFAAFSHHNLLDQIQTALTRTESAISRRDLAQFAIEHSTLRVAVWELKESEIPNAANIF